MKFKVSFINLLIISITKYTLENIISQDVTIQSKMGKLRLIAASLMERCFIKDAGAIIFIGNWSSNDFSLLNSTFSSLLPIYLVSPDKNSIFHRYKGFRFIYKFNDSIITIKKNPVSYVAIFITSVELISSVLTNFQDSIWWNNQALLLIVVQQHNSCFLANDILHLIWKLNISSAFYLCFNAIDDLVLYTFNPYSQTYLKYWHVTPNNGFRNNRWSLFYQIINYTDGSWSHYGSICGGFDKTRNLHQYNIKGLAYLDYKKFVIDESKTGYEKYLGPYHDIFRIFLSYINASVSVNPTSSLGFIDDDGHPQEALFDVLSGNVDILLVPLLTRDNWKIQCHLYETLGIKAVTLKHTTLFVDRYSLFKPWHWLILIIICITVIIALKILLNDSVFEAFLEFLRIFIGGSTIKVPEDLSKRILFLILILIIFILSSIIYVQLKSITIAPKTGVITIDSIDDIIKSNLTVLGTATERELLLNQKIRERFRLSNINECLELLSRGYNFVCIHDTNTLILLVQNNTSVHLTRDDLVARYLTFIVPEDWPLHSRLSLFLLRMKDSGISTYLRKRSNNDKTAKKTDETVMPTEITVEEIMICLVILSGGWILGMIVFIIENISHRLYNNHK